MVKTEKRSEATLRSFAFNEAGHAVAAIAQGLTVRRVSIVRRGINDICKYVPPLEYFTESFVNQQEILRRCSVVAWAGAMAEAASQAQAASRRWPNPCFDPANLNIGNQDANISYAVIPAAYSLRGWTWTISKTSIPGIEDVVLQAMKDAGQLIERELTAVLALAKELQARRWLRGKEVHSIVTPLLVKPMPVVETIANR